MAYYGRDPKTIIEQQKYWDDLRQRAEKAAHRKRIRAGPATDVYRAPKPLGGQPGRAFKPGELEETLDDWQHFYNKKNLASDPLSLGKSATEALKEKQAKIDTRSNQLSFLVIEPLMMATVSLSISKPFLSSLLWKVLIPSSYFV